MCEQARQRPVHDSEGVVMGFLDDAKKLVDEHEDQVDAGIEKAGDLVDEKTGDKYAGQIDKGQEFIEGKTGDN
jgi:MT0933-like antitoxin protein